ncbi:MAG: STM4013/SEN3800 family hydrolase [Myxococcales bacterium]|nr:STM4013/SEN3800 family hydrolase [Myxococcales bacterium]
MISFKAAHGTRDVLLLTLDALRYDVAQSALAKGILPNLATLIPHGFEARHTPATFTFAAHQAFFAGFFPTPIAKEVHPRPLALRFPGSRSTGKETLILDGTSLVDAFARTGYRTICIGGTGFFNPSTQLGQVLPSLFQEAHFHRSTSVASPIASRTQFQIASQRLRELPSTQRVFLFINASATHPPTRIFVKGARKESTETQAAALADLDRHLPILLDALRARGGAVGIICSDHGTCFDEPSDDGYDGHRHAHPNVFTVPYAEVEVTV